MFHDRNLTDSPLINLAFDLNAHAVKLALLVEWYKRRGERTLPVQYLKRLGFTRRQWELATKGTRQYDGRKLSDPRPAKDGCEAIGLISEHIEICPETKRPKTYWVIGQIDGEALAAIRKQREEAAFDVIEDKAPEPAPESEPVEPSVKPATQTPDESAYDRGYADGEAHGYDKGVRDLEAALSSTGCVKDATIELDTRDASKTHSVQETELREIIEYCEEKLREIWWDESESHLGF